MTPLCYTFGTHLPCFDDPHFRLPVLPDGTLLRQLVDSVNGKVYQVGNIVKVPDLFL